MQDDKMVADYLVQSLKENLDDLEDRYSELNQKYKRRYRECDQLERNHERIKKDYQILQQSVKSKRELIEKNGLTINHLDQTKFNNNHDTNGMYISSYVNSSLNNVHTVSNDLINSKSDEIKQNGHKLDQHHQINSHHHRKLNGQFEQLPTTNGFSSNELTNGYNGHNLSNHSSSSLNKRYTDLSSCSSLSSTNDKTCSTASLIFSDELYQLITYIEGKTLNEKINFLLHDKISKLQKIKSLKSGLDDEKIKSIKLESLSLINGKQLNGDLHRKVNHTEDSKKTIDNCKKELEMLSKQMQELSDIKSRIDNDILQLKTRLQTMEETEHELKAENRKLLRQFRENQAKIEELDTENYHLRKRMDKLSKNTKISS